MGQGDDVRWVLAEGSHRGREGVLAGAAEQGALGVLTDCQGQLDGRELGQQRGMPARGALRAGWQISSCSATGVAQPHRYDCHLLPIVEDGAIDPQPVAESLAAGVMPGNAAAVDFRAGSLSDDEQPGSMSRLQYRSGA